MSADIPINQFVGVLAVHKDIFSYGNWLILQRISVSRKSSPASRCPTCALWFFPENVVNKIITFFDEQPMHVKWDRNSLGRFAAAGSSNEHRGNVDSKKPAFSQDT